MKIIGKTKLLFIDNSHLVYLLKLHGENVPTFKKKYIMKMKNIDKSNIEKFKKYHFFEKFSLD